MGFMTDLPVSRSLHVLPQCGRCGLYKGGCRSPKMKVSGGGAEGILVVGDHPEPESDRGGEPFLGPEGRRLKASLSRCGIDLRRDCWSVYSLACRADGGRYGKKEKQMVEWCRPNVSGTITALNPKVVILLGANAVRSVIGWLWKEDTEGIVKWVGWRIPLQRLNAWVCPTFDLSEVAGDKPHAVASAMFDRHLKAAVELRHKRPWKAAPDWKSKVRCVYDPGEAAELLDGFAERGKPVAFDYETNMLKPDSKLARIYCCSVSDGQTTIAYPWHGAAVDATKRLLSSSVPKVGYNIKFEDRWTEVVLKCRVRNWTHDGMVVAHCLDNRHGIAGLKFQAFVQLGMESYNDTVTPYLQAQEDGGYAVNRIKDAPLDALLLYCGLDSLLEYKLWERQTKVLNAHWTK